MRPSLNNMLVSEREQAVIEVSASGDNQIIAAPGVGARIQIVHLSFIVRDIVNVRLLSDAVQLSGLWNFEAGMGYTFDASDGFTLFCQENDAFIINLSAAIGIDGLVCFYREAA